MKAESKAGELDSEDLTRFEAEIPILFHSRVLRDFCASRFTRLIQQNFGSNFSKRKRCKLSLNLLN